MTTNLIMLGAGGHAGVLIDCLRQISDVTIIGILDANPAMAGKKYRGIPVLGADEKITDYSPEKILLVNAIGSADIPLARKTIFQLFKSRGYGFYSVIHPTVYLGMECKLGEGVQIMAGSIIQPGVTLGDNVIINTRSSIDHDCHIGAHTHIACGVTLSGNVNIEGDSHIGAGATIIQSIKIGKSSLVGAGSVVIQDIQLNSRVAGVPAQRIETSREIITDEELE